MNSDSSAQAHATDSFFEQPILNSPYEYPRRHWELDEEGRPTSRIVAARRPAKFVTPIPKAKHATSAPSQLDLGVERDGTDQAYDLTSVINEVRGHVDRWRALPKQEWHVMPETARLLHHWRTHPFGGIRPFFCQIEAVETLIWSRRWHPEPATAGASSRSSFARTRKRIQPWPGWR